MAWWGKAIGGALGFMLGGPLGALLGAAVGHPFDKGLAQALSESPAGDRERVQGAFFSALFSVMGHLAKVDGQVSPREVSMAEALMARMSLSAVQKRIAVELFNRGKLPDFDLEAVLDQFRRECHGRLTLIRFFLEVQIEAALADGRVDAAENRLLRTIFELLGQSPRELDRVLAFAQGAQSFHRDDAPGGRQGSASSHGGKRPIENAFRVLGVAPTATNAEIKTAYRRLMSQHHPDKLVAKGLPEEMQRIAKERTQEIGAAYNLVREVRGF